MFAAKRGAVEAVKLLLDEQGLQNAQGYTALMVAAENGFLEIVKLLVGKEAGKKTNRPNTKVQDNAKQLAKDKHQDEVAKYLDDYEKSD